MRRSLYLIMVTSIVSIITVMILSGTASASSTAFKDIPGLNSITFWEQTGDVTDHNFLVTSSELLNQLPGNLGSINKDFTGADDEFYDVFYSNADGSFNADGKYLTIECLYAGHSSSGSMNINQIDLNFSGGKTAYANVLVNYHPGTGYISGSELYAVDGIMTTTPMLGVSTGISDRLRLTVDYVPTPIPTAIWLFGSGLLGLLGIRRKIREA
jgi:hypothetical protein